MAQLIYSILALLLVMVVSMNTQRSVMSTAEDQAFNEVATQMTGVGTEVLERIGRTHFDRYAWYYGASTSTISGTTAQKREKRRQRLCGRLNENEADSLGTPVSLATYCSTLGNPYRDCPFIDGFHNLPDFTLTRGQFEFTVDTIRVEFVNPADFNDGTWANAKSFAKRVTVSVEYPGIYFNDDPTNTLRLDLDRVFIYGCVTDPATIPQPPPGEFCPDDRTPPVPVCSISS